MKKDSRVLRIISGALLAVLFIGSFMLTDIRTLFLSIWTGNLFSILQLLSMLLYLALLVCLWIPAVWSNERWLRRMMISAVAISAVLEIAAYLNSWYLMANVYHISSSDRQGYLLSGAFSYHGLVPHLFLLSILLLMITLLFGQEAKVQKPETPPHEVPPHEQAKDA